MRIGEAIQALQAQECVTRASWSRGQYLELRNGIIYYGEPHRKTHMFAPCQADLLTDDWIFYTPRGVTKSEQERIRK